MKLFMKSFVVSLLLLILSYKLVSATEGTFELRSTDTNNYKCFAASLQMQDLNYTILLSCRNLIFPLDETIYSYILWANPEGGGNAFKLGSINLGRGQYKVKPPFTSLFITAEQNPGVKNPTGKVVMKGSIKPITFLEKEVSPVEETSENGGTTTPTPTPQTQTSIRDRILSGLKRAGLATGLALVAILGLVFILTRPK
jgi:hypothetical protein